MTFETIFVGLLVLVVGAAFCFGGFKWFPILLPLWGFAVGFFIGSSRVYSLYSESILSIMVVIVAGLILGLMLAVVAYLFFNFAIIIIAASTGYFLISSMIVSLGFEPGLISAIVGLIIAAIIAYIAVRINLPKYVVIFFTALDGSLIVFAGIFILIGVVPLDDLYYGVVRVVIGNNATWRLLFIILAITGSMIQLRRAKGYAMDTQSQNNA